MKNETHHVEKGVGTLSKEAVSQVQDQLSDIGINMKKKNLTLQTSLSIPDGMVEGVYAQAYRLFNSGKYEEAADLFRLLILLNSIEPRYIMGLGACYHMAKNFKGAADTYMICGVVDPDNPVPHYHASDCYLQMNDKESAIVVMQLAATRCKDLPQYKLIKDRALLTIETLTKEISKDSK